jgi:hypothetical protein
MRLRRGAALSECGWGVRAAAEGVGQYGSAGLGAEPPGSASAECDRGVHAAPEGCAQRAGV